LTKGWKVLAGHSEHCEDELAKEPTGQLILQSIAAVEPSALTVLVGHAWQVLLAVGLNVLAGHSTHTPP
jgi:hypothetical protein